MVDLLSWLKGGAARVREWNRARMERIQVKRAERQAQREADQHHHSRFFLLTVPAIATICAAFVEWYWALLFCIEATGWIEWNWETTAGNRGEPGAWLWDFGFSAHIPVLVGLLAATAPIVMVSMVWLPVQFAMRGAGVWRRGTLIACGVLANILVVISGTVVMNYNRQESVREALVVEQQAGQNRGAIQAQIDAVNADLARLSDRRANNEYAATAANVGAVAYRAQYMSAEALQRSPEQRRDIIVRALGAAERADALRSERTALIQQLAAAPTEAAVAANVQDNVGRELNTFAQYVEVWRPPFVAFICTLIGIFGAWWVLAMLERMNPKDVMRSGWADEGHRIEDMREQVVPTAEPMKPAREEVFDSETGERLIKIKPKEHWRRQKGKPQKVDVQRESVEVEYEGRKFATSGAAEESPGAGGWGTHGPSVLASPGHPASEGDGNDQPATEIQAPEQSFVQPDSPIELPDLTDEEQAAIEAELATEADDEAIEQREPFSSFVDEPQSLATESDHDLPEESHEPQPERRPERLLTNVAAE